MDNYTLSKEQIKELKNIFQDDAQTWHRARVEIMDNILPELFKKDFKVGKYYEYVEDDTHFVFKLTELDKVLNHIGLCGYGLDLSDEYGGFDENACWCDENDTDYLKEITATEFLEHLKEYAVDVLGFKQGVDCYWKDVNLTHKNLQGEVRVVSNLEALDMNNKLIFHEGKFAEIVTEEKSEPTKEEIERVLEYLKNVH